MQCVKKDRLSIEKCIKLYYACIVYQDNLNKSIENLSNSIRRFCRSLVKILNIQIGSE